jgi:hypothetical protein
MAVRSAFTGLVVELAAQEVASSRERHVPRRRSGDVEHGTCATSVGPLSGRGLATVSLRSHGRRV